MPIRNTANSYGSITKTLHWLTALLILVLIPLGMIAHGMADALRDPTLATTPENITRTAWLFSLHKTLGIALFFTALARVIWGLSQPKPGPLSDIPFQSLLAEILHKLLYGTLILTPLVGWAHHAATTGFAPIWWPFPQSLPFVPKSDSLAHTFAGLHLTLVTLLVLAVLLHIAGALKHQLIDRDATLRRMLPGTPPASPTHTRPKSRLPAIIAVGLLTLAIGIGLGRSQHQAQLQDQTQAQHQAQTQANPEHATLLKPSTNWSLTKGDLGLTITLFGSKLSGTFADWTADITFTEPTQPGPAGQVTATIAIKSLVLGSVSQQAMGPDYFDVERYPTATFSADIQKTATGYLATGPLTIRDQTVITTLPFDLLIIDDRATITAALSLNRRDFGVGSTQPDESSLGFAVTLNITLDAQHHP